MIALYFIYICIAFCFAVTCAYYYNFKNKLISVIAFTSIISITFILHSYFSLSSFNLYILLLFEILIVTSFKNGFTQENYLIALILVIADMLSSILSLCSVQFFTHSTMSFILHNDAYLEIACIVELILFIIACIHIYLLKMKKSLSYNQNNWKEMNTILIIIFVFLLTIKPMMIKYESIESIILVFIIAIITIAIFFMSTYHKILAVHQENTEHLLNEQRYKYNQINKDAMMRANDEIKKLEHRMSYSLLQIKNSLLASDQQSAIEIIDEYTQKLNQFHSSIMTNNPYFDFIMNKQINELYLQGYTVKLSTTLTHQTILENKVVLDNICGLINDCAKLSQDHDISIDFSDKGNYVLLKLSIETSSSLDTFKSIISSYSHHTFHKYDINLENDTFTCRILIKANDTFIS